MTSSDPKKLDMCFLIMEVFQIWEKTLDIIKQDRHRTGFMTAEGMFYVLTFRVAQKYAKS